VVSTPQCSAKLEISAQFLTPKCWGSTLVAHFGFDQKFVAGLRLEFRRASNATKLVCVLSLMFFIVACATVPPVQEMSDARQAIAAATEAGAESYALGQLQQAQNSLAAAEGFLQVGTSSAYWQARKAAISAKEMAFDALLTSRNAQDSGDTRQ
jgi:hypothetical protein